MYETASPTRLGPRPMVNVPISVTNPAMRTVRAPRKSLDGKGNINHVVIKLKGKVDTIVL